MRAVAEVVADHLANEVGLLFCILFAGKVRLDARNEFGASAKSLVLVADAEAPFEKVSN